MRSFRDIYNSLRQAYLGENPKLVFKDSNNNEFEVDTRFEIIRREIAKTETNLKDKIRTFNLQDALAEAWFKRLQEIAKELTPEQRIHFYKILTAEENSNLKAIAEDWDFIRHRIKPMTRISDFASFLLSAQK